MNRPLTWIVLFFVLIVPIAARNPAPAVRQDLSAGEFFIKMEFTPEDADGFPVDPPEVRKTTVLPIFPNRMFAARVENRIREYTIMTRFQAGQPLREIIRPALKIKGIGENWAVYLNGHPLREEIHRDERGDITRYSHVRNLILPLPPGTLREENVLVFRVMGHAPASFISDNFLLGLTFSRDYAVGDEWVFIEENDQTLQLILYGVYIFFGLYHLLFYVRRRQSAYNLFFGLFSIVLAVYFLAFSNRAFDLIQDFHTQIFTAYVTQPLALALFLGFLYTYFYPDRPFSRFLQIALVANGLVIFAILVVPYRFYQTCLLGWYILAAPQLAYVFIFMGQAIHRRLPDARKMALGLSSGIIFVIWDILDTVFFNTQIRLVQYGHLLIILSLVTILANRFLAVHIRSEMLNEELVAERNAFARFVPAEFLEHLNHKAIQDIRLGDFTRRNMTILVSDIRNFTAISEKMSPEKNFEFLNDYLGRIGPLVRAHNGFIDKYIGDAIMALFPNSADDAILAAIEIRQELELYNSERIGSGMPLLDIGIGIHTGNLILGTIGEEERMEGTVISDAVNQAFRLESLTKTLGAAAILSTHTLHGLEDPTRYEVRFLGKVHVKGKNDKVSIYELLDGLPPDRKERRLASRSEFEHALFLYYNEEFRKAGEILRDLEEKFPEDQAIKTFRIGCETGVDL